MGDDPMQPQAVMRSSLDGAGAVGDAPDAGFESALKALGSSRSQGRLPMPIAQLPKRATARLGAVVLAGLLAACGSSDSSDSSDGAGGKVTLRPLRVLRLQGGRALRGVPEAQPEHHDQAERHPGRGGLLEVAPDPAGRRRRPGGRAGRGGGPYRVGHPAAVRQVPGPEGVRGRQAQGRVRRGQVVGGDHQGRQDPRPWHGCRPRGDVLPHGPLQGGRAAHGPRGAGQEVGHVGRLPGAGQGVQEEGPRQERLAGQRLARSTGS
ncbi:hypothetical protein SBADM41S_00162 [Streptomyces badius]